MNGLSLELYQKLYLIRKAEELIIKHYPEDEMKSPMHMSMGQEAVAVAVSQALGSMGKVFGFYRSHALFLAMTMDPDQFFGELYGRITGTAQGKAGSMHLAAYEKGFMCASAIVASSIPLAVGAGFANKQKSEGGIACAYFGDGALEEGVFWESLNVACVMEIPMLFLCEDNGLAVHSKPDIRQGFDKITDIVERFNCGVFLEDSTDVEILYNRVSEAMDFIKTNKKPAFLHAKCRRYLDHIGIDAEFNINFDSKVEFDEWKEKDSIAIQRKRLLSQGMKEKILLEEESQIDSHLERSVLRAASAPYPEPQDIYRGVFYEGN